MRVLIVEDDMTSRRLLSQFLQPHGDCQVAENGEQALLMFRKACEDQQPYSLVCLDIMMPEMDGHAVLKHIRQFEQQAGIAHDHSAKVIVTSALDDSQNVLGAFQGGCEGYLVKPIRKEELIHQLEKLGLIEG